MHILMISDGETEGGAAVAASRLASALCREGHRVTRFVNYCDGRRHEWTTLCLCPDLRTRLKRRISNYPIRAHVANRYLREILRQDPPDIIHFHNIHDSVKDGWSLDLVEIACGTAPVFWTLHDMWSFTGGCAYAEDRTGESAAALRLPAGGVARDYSAEPGFSRAIWRRQERLMATQPALEAIAPSHWLQREAQAGLWQDHPVHRIPYGLVLETYEPLDRALARKALGLPTGLSKEYPVLMFAAVTLSDARKGGALLRGALEQLTDFSPLLLLMGNGELEIDAPHIRQSALGFVANDRLKALAYSAADLFVHPALKDNLPIVVMEAIACGTPVASFPIGGMHDMIHPGRTGWLAGAVNAEALAATITEGLNNIVRGNDLRISCRTFAEAHWSETLQAERHLELFHRALHGDLGRAVMQQRPLSKAA